MDTLYCLSKVLDKSDISKICDIYYFGVIVLLALQLRKCPKDFYKIKTMPWRDISKCSDH